MPKLSYYDLREIYDYLESSGTVTETLPEWAASQNAATGTNDFDAGVNEGYVIKPFFNEVRKAVDATGLPDVGAAIGGVFGQKGEDIGRGAVRGAVNLLPMLASAPVAIPSMAVLAAGDAYTETDSAGSALMAGSVAAVMPKVFNIAEQYALKRMGGEYVSGVIGSGAARSSVDQYFAKNILQGVGSQVSGTLAAGALSEASRMAEAGLRADDPNNPASTYDFDPERIALEMTIGQVPFTLFQVASRGGRVAFGGKTTQEHVATLRKQIADTAIADAATRVIPRSKLETLMPTGETLNAEMLARQAELLATPVDPKLGEAVTEAENAVADLQAGTITPEVAAAKVTQANITLDGKEHLAVGSKQAYIDSQPKTNIDGTLEHVQGGRVRIFVEDTQANRDAGLPIGSMLEFPGHSTDLTRKVGEPASFLIPTDQKYITVKQGDKLRLDLEERTRRLTPKVEEPKNLQDELPANTENEAAFNKWWAERQADLAQQREKARLADSEQERRLEEADATTEEIFTTLKSDAHIDPVKKAALLQQIYDVNKAVGIELSPEDLKVYGSEPVKIVKGAVKLKEVIKGKAKRLQDNEKVRQTQEEVQASAVGKLQELSKSKLPTDIRDYAVYTKALELYAARLKKNPLDEKLRNQNDNLITDFVAWYEAGSKGKFIPDDQANYGESWSTKARSSDDEEKILNTAAKDVTDDAKESVGDFLSGIKARVVGEPSTELVEYFGSEDAARSKLNDDWEELAEANFAVKNFDEKFLSQPHVVEWLEAVGKIAREKRAERLPAPMQPRTSAGDGFVWDMVPYDEATNKIGKHTLSKNSEIAVSVFKSIAGEPTLADLTIKLGRLMVPKAFTADGKVNVRVLVKGLKEKGPVVEVKKLGEGAIQQHPKERRYRELLHDLDTKAPGWRGTPSRSTKWPELKELFSEVAALQHDAERVEFLDTRPPDANYSFLGPKSEQDMPGYVEGLVRVPKADTKSEELYKKKGTYYTTAEHNAAQKADKVLYTGPHFGSEDTNVLAFFRGYEETLPDGRKAFHVIEVQSDWGQQQKKAQDYVRQFPQANRGEATKRDLEGHPLLSVYEPLALKAAIAHARSIGADALILSDGETAMMTEGHDKGAMHLNGFKEKIDAVIKAGELDKKYNRGGVKDAFNVIQDGDNWAITVASHFVPNQGVLRQEGFKLSQEGGMSLHYDQTLPSAMKKLTGTEGERVELGVHDKAKDTRANNDYEFINDGQVYSSLESAQKAAREAGVPETNVTQDPSGEPRWRVFNATENIGSPVFRNPDGTPKSSITGRLYDLRQAFANMDQRGGFTLGGKSFAPEPYAPKTPVEVQTMAHYGKTATDMLGKIATESRNPEYSALAKHFQQYPDLIARLNLHWHDAKESYVIGKGRHQGDMYLSSGLLGESSQWREFVMLHEMGHQLTIHQYDNPAFASTRDALSALRQRAIEGLPANLRKKLDAAVESNWYERHRNGEDVENLSDNQQELNLLYGMLSDKEFLTQGWSDAATKNYLAGLKSEAKLTGWQKFKAVVKEFMGLSKIKEGSVYDEFMFHSSALMETGNQVAKYFDFAENWLQHKGVLDSTHNDSLTNRTYNLLEAGANRKLNARDILSWLSPSQYEGYGYETPKMRATRRELDRHVKTKTVDYEELLDVALQNKFEPTVKGLDDVFDGYVRGDVSWPADFDFLPSSAKAYLVEKTKDYNLILGLAKGALENTKFVAVAENKALLSEIRRAQGFVDKINLMQHRHEKGLELAQTLMEVTPDNSYALLQRMATPPTPKARKVTETLMEGPLDKLQTFFEQPAQLARHNPLFAEMYSRTSLVQNKISQWIKTATSLFNSDLSSGVPRPATPETIASMKSALSSSRVKTAVDEWLWAAQDEGGQAVGFLDPSNPRVKATLSKLTPAEQAQVIDVMSRVGLSNAESNLQKQRVMTDEYAHYGARVLMTKLGLNNDVALEAAGQMIDAIYTIKDNPQEAPIGQAKLVELQSRLGSDGYMALLEVSSPAVDKLMEQKQYDKANLFFVSAQRGGKFKFDYWFQGELVSASADSMAEAKQKVGSLKIENWRENENHNTPDVGFDAVERQKRIKELSENLRAALVKHGLSAEGQAVFDTLDIAVQNEKDYASAKNAPNNTFRRNRRLSKGAEKLPWLEHHLAGITKNASYWNKRLLRIQAETLLMSPDYVADPTTAKKAKTHLESVLSEDPETVRMIQKAVTQISLGGNVSGYLVNGLQPVMRTLPEMIKEFGELSGSAKELARAGKDYISHKAGMMDWKTKEENEFYRQALHDGKVDSSKFDESQGKFDSSSEDLMKLLKRDVPRTKTQKTVSAMSALGDWSMGLYRNGERANATVSLMAAFRMAKKKGLDFNSAKEKAYAIHAAANDVGGRANRSIGMFDNKGKWERGAAMFATTLQNYTIGTITQMMRFGHSSFDKSLTPAERFAARKAMVAMGSVQLAAAGAIGLPFMATLLALLEETAPQMEPTKMFRSAVSWATGAGFGGEPNQLTEVLMSGLPSLMGWDWQSRLSVGNTVPGINEFNGVQPEALFGVPIILAINYGKGIGQLAQGNVGGAVDKFTPAALKKLSSLIKDDGMLKDYRDRPIFNDLSELEKLGATIGFNPKRLSDFNSASRMKERSRVVENEKTYRERQSFAQQVLKGQINQVANVLKQKKAQDATFDYEAEIRNIAETAESLAFPRDLQAETTGKSGQSQQQVLNMYRLPNTAVTEKTRTLFKQNIEQRFGLRTNYNRAVRKADLLDRLKAQNPTLSRAELLKLAAERN